MVGNIITAHDSRNEADSKFFAVLSVAAISTVEKHACALLTENEVCIRSEPYKYLMEE